MDSDEGTVVNVGRVPGRQVGVDPKGRIVTTVRDATVTTYDAASLEPVATHPVGGFLQVKAHPSGAAVAALSDDWSIGVWRGGRRIASRETGLAAKGATGFPSRLAWLAFTASGSHLLAGLADPGGGPVRLELLDPATLDLLDTADGFPGGYPGYDPATPPTDWGEGVSVGYAPTTGPAVGDVVALAANVGDDPHTLVVVEVANGRLRLHTSTVEEVFAAQIPGERINDVALDAAGTMYVLDDDRWVTAFAWHDPDLPPRQVLAGFDLSQELFGDRSDRYEFDGSLFVIGDRLAVPVVELDSTYLPRRMTIQLVDPVSGAYTGRLDVPEWLHDPSVFAGLLLADDGDDGTHVARWSVDPR